MWAVAFGVVVLVVVAVAVALVRRPRGDDIHSVANYNHTLGTLEHLSERIGPPTVRPVRVVPMGQSGSTERVVPPVPVRGTDEFPDPDAPIVFDDARPVERGRPGGAGPATLARTDRAQRMALDSMNHRSRRGTGVMIVVAAVVVFGALAILGSQKSHNSSHTRTTTTTRPAGSGATTTLAKPTPTARPTPTTLPNQFVATTTSSAGTAATYTVPHTTFQITITGTGSCWVQVGSGATGATVWAGELSAGTVQNVQASGSTTVQFGTPSLNLQVDGVPVVLPTSLRTPFVATFSPSATATPGTAAVGPSSSTTTTTTSPSTASTSTTATTTTTAAP